MADVVDFPFFGVVQERVVQAKGEVWPHPFAARQGRRGRHRCRVRGGKVGQQLLCAIQEKCHTPSPGEDFRMPIANHDGGQEWMGGRKLLFCATAAGTTGEGNTQVLAAALPRWSCRLPRRRSLFSRRIPLSLYGCVHGVYAAHHSSHDTRWGSGGGGLGAVFLLECR